MTLLDGQFNFLRIKVAAADNYQILQSTRDEQLSISEESQVSGAQKRPLPGIRQKGATDALAFLRLVPITRRNARTGNPDLAHHIGWASSQCLRIDDDNFGIEHRSTASDQRAHVVFLVGHFNDAILLER